MESDEDFAEWVTTRNVTGNAGGVVEDLRSMVHACAGPLQAEFTPLTRKAS
jgi:hypothetical protein